MHARIIIITRIETSALLPELDVVSRPIGQRRDQLVLLLNRVQELQQTNLTAGQEVTDWVKFLSWYQRCSSQFQRAVRSFSRFIEDEREKEGRLFSRWVALAELYTQQFLDKQAGIKPQGVQPQVPGSLCAMISFNENIWSHCVTLQLG